MPLTINSNFASLNAQRRLMDSTAALSKTFQRLSSGLRINQAADDAAGLAVASQLNSDARVYSQGIRNLNDGLNAFAIAEGAVNGLSNIIIRIRELSEQSSNGTVTFTQRRALNAEANALVNEYNRIVSTTSFNGQNLVDGSLSTLSLQNGYGDNGSLVLGIGSALQRGVGDGTFKAQTQYAAGGNPTSAIVADVNGDGIYDIVSTSYGNNSANVHIGIGDGTFKAYQGYDVGSRPYMVQAADLNEDGKLDLVTANHTSNNVSVLIGNGNGSFYAAVNLGTGVNAMDVKLADFNGDGHTDIAAADNGSAEIVLFLGHGNGTFASPITNSFVHSTRFFISTDVNNDGKLDLVNTHGGIGTAGILIGNGNGTFKAEQEYYAVSEIISGVTSGDFNHDGNTDLLVGSDGGIHLMYGNGNGSFKIGVTVASGFATNVQAVDLNEDGQLDVVSADGFSNTTSVVMGNSDGSFRVRVAYTTDGNSETVIAQDLNGDGRRELVVANEAGNISVLLGNGGSTAYLAGVNLLTQASSLAVLDQMKVAHERITTELGSEGAAQSRIMTAVSNLTVIRENNLRAASQIMDVDVAAESSHLVRSRILQQAGAAVLAQANQQPALTLQLLNTI